MSACSTTWPWNNENWFATKKNSFTCSFIYSARRQRKGRGRALMLHGRLLHAKQEIMPMLQRKPDNGAGMSGIISRGNNLVVMINSVQPRVRD